MTDADIDLPVIREIARRDAILAGLLRDVYNERVAICAVDGVPISEAKRIALEQFRAARKGVR